MKQLRSLWRFLTVPKETNTEKPVPHAAVPINDLEQIIGIKELVTQQDFLDVLTLEWAIIYMQVEWSGPERSSRSCVYNALNEIGVAGTPVFKIECSDQTKRYIVDWLIEQKRDKADIYYGGSGETLLLNKGNIIEHIRYPAGIGYAGTKEKLMKWKNVTG